MCLLDVLVALLGAARSARCTSTTACASGADADERHCRRCAQRSALSSRSCARRRARAGRGQRAGVGARPALRGRRARGAGDGALVPPGTPPATRWRRSSTGSPRRPDGARCWGWRAARGACSARCSALTREQTGAYCRARGLALARGPEQRLRALRARRACATAVPALRALHPAAEANVLRTAALLREEAELLDGLVERRARPAASSIALARLRDCAGARAAGGRAPRRGRQAAPTCRGRARAWTSCSPRAPRRQRASCTWAAARAL